MKDIRILISAQSEEAFLIRDKDGCPVYVMEIGRERRGCREGWRKGG